MAAEPYASHITLERIKNDADGTFHVESGAGAMATLDIGPLGGVSYANGVFGYITLGIQIKYIRNGSTVDTGKYIINLELVFLTRNG
ncbi:hypothetical protein N7499_006244 [Penicillium canescens]|uniref:Uncharacterized protein n=1 Tax=Penicillium canescens TaxID=5083 RepID=A0AAD6NAC2_PENCN|nr:uncharacterized protein N7446_002023 [Penicillium canescens]KAJ6043825.1 hypothetical protein N7460_005180 [Penicillium canescens]KAJ6055299.1 hypothetical protein N7444_004397 [Penicillium canescens]KAJ6074246.1 hypothetical protein N7446_002023 [Penicillium canescens]KAJ6081370.1 hypothetical protein N7499_006244 [Penicillium canescens]KAJ6176833.1 hypothetical protein N7485_003747 [Penicillium canescens]